MSFSLATDTCRIYWRRCFGLLVGMAMLSMLPGCDVPSALEDWAGTSEPEASPVQQSFPPDRALYERLAPQDIATHGQTVLAALERAEHDPPHVWSGSEPGLEGSIVITETRGLNNDEEFVCRYFFDELNFRGETVRVGDAACWVIDGWYWLRDEPNRPVAEGLPLDFQFYTIKSGGTLADVARVTSTDLAELERLNPTLKGSLSKGTGVRLP
ncbi:MAG: LysM domain-containing protein [Pseudomonadota bacterium]